MSRLLGGNIRPGQRPGGMTGVCSGIKVKAVACRKPRGYDSAGEVRAAARAFLEKRGFHNQISDFERAAMNFPRASVKL